jgi:hypothetical protein
MNFENPSDFLTQIVIAKLAFKFNFTLIPRLAKIFDNFFHFHRSIILHSTHLNTKVKVTFATFVVDLMAIGHTLCFPPDLKVCYKK